MAYRKGQDHDQLLEGFGDTPPISREKKDCSAPIMLTCTLETDARITTLTSLRAPRRDDLLPEQP